MTPPIDGEVVRVTQTGQATIPKEMRDALGIDAPGRVIFRQTEGDEIVVERAPSAHDLAGSFGEPDTDKPLTELLREDREDEKAADEDRLKELRGQEGESTND